MPPFNKFTQQEKQYLLDNFENMTLRQMAAALNRSEGGVKTWVLKLGLRRKKRFDWTDEKIGILVALYPNHSAKEIAARLGTNDYVIYKKAERLELKKSPEYLAALNKQMGENLQKNGCATRFVKGQKPWSYGKKIGTRGRTAETQFKKGQMPYNHQPVGTILPVSTQPYLKIKIAEPNVWEFLHRHNWEKVNGKIPEGFVIYFKDQNPHNCAVENLELITRAELRKRTSIHNYPADLKELIQTLGLLKRTISRRVKNAKEQN
jgi:hypothetical protein